MAPKSPDLLNPRAKSTFLTLSLIDPGGCENNEFAPSSSEINVFDLELDRSRWLRNHRICSILERNQRFRAWWLRSVLDLELDQERGFEVYEFATFRTQSTLSTSSWIDPGGSEINEFVAAPNEIHVFDLELDRSRWLRNHRIWSMPERNQRF